MTKSLCKYRRVEIAAQIATITHIVSAPKYICRSCARVASDKAHLCKPVAISLQRGKTADSIPAKITTELLVQPFAPVKQHPAKWATLGKKEARRLKKLAKKKAKKFKQASKALKRYNAALKKADVE